METIPSTFSEAMRLPESVGWKAATEKMNRLNDLGVSTLISKSTIPPGKITRARWLFMRNADDTFKTCIVARGWNAVPGVNCGAMFSPVCRLQSIWMARDNAADNTLAIL